MTNKPENPDDLQPLTAYDIAVRDFKVRKYDELSFALDEEYRFLEADVNYKPESTWNRRVADFLTADMPKPEDYK